LLKLGSRWATTQPTVAGYGVAIASVGGAVAGLALMQARWQAAAHASILLMAVIVATRFGGTKPGVLAAGLGLLGFHYLQTGATLDSPAQLLRLISFAVVAGYVVWLNAIERARSESLERAHDEVQQQNEALRTENLERKRTEEALRDSQQLLVQVLATLPVGVAVTDRAGDIILSNHAVDRIWGGRITQGSERWVQSKGWWHDSGQRIEPPEWASVRAISQGQTSLNELLDIETHHGERKTLQNSAAPIRGADGQILGAVIVNEDVTERVRTDEALRESADRLQHLSRRLLSVQDEERRHLSRELHDEFGQLLASVTLHLQAAKRTAGQTAQPSLDESIALLQRAGAQVRSLALELRPMLLETAGLDATLRWLAEQYQQRTGIATDVVGHANDVSSEVANACFRVAQEALTNVVRHATAHHVWIELSQSEGVLGLEVRDDGIGFDVAGTLERAAGSGNLGLLGMRERVQILGGRLVIDSRPGHGTRIHVSFPLTEPAAEPAAQTA
jgi:PAS domain S-box-containing protein